MIILFSFPSSMVCCCYVKCCPLFIESEHSYFFSVYFASVGLFPLNRIIYHNTTPPEHTETITWEANKRSCSQFGCSSRNFLSYEFSINGLRRKMKLGGEKVFKDGAGLLLLLPYVLRISRYSGFLWVVPTNTGIFLRGLKAIRRK